MRIDWFALIIIIAIISGAVSATVGLYNSKELGLACIQAGSEWKENNCYAK